MRVSILASAAALKALAPLLSAYERHHSPRIVETGGEVPSLLQLRQLAANTDALLLIGPRRRSPRTVLPAPVLADTRGRHIPVGWLPEMGSRFLGKFASAAARVHQRSVEEVKPVIAVLSQWNPRYLHLARRIEGLLEMGERPIALMRWSADRIIRKDLLQGLGCGLSAAFYVGHGRPIGWVGYHGTRAHHFQAFTGEPLGTLFSLCCTTASRRRTGLSFSEALPLLGSTAACFGAVEPTLHADNTRWALGLCQSIRQQPWTLGELILRSLPTSGAAVNGYRILGDPLAPLATTPTALDLAAMIGRYEECPCA